MTRRTMRVKKTKTTLLKVTVLKINKAKEIRLTLVWILVKPSETLKSA